MLNLNADINFTWLLLSIILLSLLTRSRTGLMTLLTAEFAWVTLFIIGMMVGLRDDSISPLALTFFILVLSAVEFGFAIVAFTIVGSATRVLTMDTSAGFQTKSSLRMAPVKDGKRQHFTI